MARARYHFGTVMRSVATAVALELVAACGRSVPAKRPPPPDIWSFAPPGTLVAVALRYDDKYELLVAAERALIGAPGAEPVLAFIRNWLDYERVPMRNAAARRAAGYDPDGPMVYFVTNRGMVYVTRLADRAAYRRTFRVRPDPASKGRLSVDVDGSTCAAKPQGGYHVCGTREPLLAVLDGKGIRVPWPRDSGRPPTARIWLAESILGPVAGLTNGGDGLRVELELERGRLVARAQLTGEPAGQLALLRSGAKSPLATSLPRGELSGAAVVNLIAFMDAMRAQAIENTEGEMVAGSLSWPDLWNALRGDFAVWVAPDDQSGTLAVGLRKIEAIRKLLTRCEDLALPGIRASRDGDRCRLRSDMMAKAGLGDLVVRVTKDALLAEMVSPARAPRATAPPPASPPLARLRRGEDAVSLYGSGLIAQLASLAPTRTIREQEQIGLWLLLHVTESSGLLRFDGDGIRGEIRVATTWAYDAPTIAALEPIFRRMAVGELDAGAELGKLAAASPGGPLARDLARGKAGSAVPLVAGLVIARSGAAYVGNLIAARGAAVQVLDDFEEVVEAACRCKDAECAERAAARYDEWNAQHGETKIDNDSIARFKEMVAEYSKCMEPFVSDG